MPRYYQHGYQGPQYAGLWKHQLPTPQTQAPGLRYGLGDEADDAIAIATSKFPAAVSETKNLSDKELDVLIVFYREALANPSPNSKPAGLALGEAMLTALQTEKSNRRRNRFLMLGGAAAVGVYLYTKRKR